VFDVRRPQQVGHETAGGNRMTDPKDFTAFEKMVLLIFTRPLLALIKESGIEIPGEMETELDAYIQKITLDLINPSPQDIAEIKQGIEELKPKIWHTEAEQ
jgi:hypothetical protein